MESSNFEVRNSLHVMKNFCEENQWFKGSPSGSCHLRLISLLWASFVKSRLPSLLFTPWILIKMPDELSIKESNKLNILSTPGINKSISILQVSFVKGIKMKSILIQVVGRVMKGLIRTCNISYFAIEGKQRFGTFSYHLTFLKLDSWKCYLNWS